MPVCCLRDGPLEVFDDDLAAEMTLAPKNLRISASLSRCWIETDKKDARVCVEEIEAADDGETR